MNGIGEDLDLSFAVDWLVKNSNFPTFEDFCKDPDRWRNRKDSIFESADQSSQTFKKQVKSHRYSWKDQYLCESLEQIERIAKEEGFTPFDLEMSPHVKPMYGTDQKGKVEIIIQFWPKDEFSSRGGVVMDV